MRGISYIQLKGLRNVKRVSDTKNRNCLIKYVIEGKIDGGKVKIDGKTRRKT